MASPIAVRIQTHAIETRDPFDDEGGDFACGAEVLFYGRVRAHNHGRRVTGVSYDAFVPLGEKILARLCLEAQAKFDPRLQARIWHRVGRVAPGDISVLIAVRTPHRAEAYAASRFLIEEIKHQVPIWKQEHYEDGDSEWLQGHALCTREATP
ncbi:MAG: molybdenum cofactor biosynthesis protein MoaE [Bacteriovoracia bacterium]